MPGPLAGALGLPRCPQRRFLLGAFHLLHSGVAQTRKLGDMATRFHRAGLPCTSPLGSHARTQRRAAAILHPGVPVAPRARLSAAAGGFCGQPAATTFLRRWDVSAQEGLKKARDKGGK